MFSFVIKPRGEKIKEGNLFSVDDSEEGEAGMIFNITYNEVKYEHL